MRVLAVLAGLALAAPLAAKGGHARAIEIADTMEHALSKMVGGLEQFLAEAKDAETTRAARKFAGQERVLTEADLEKAEDKGTHLANQMVRNLHALAGAAKALQQAARDAPKSEVKEVPMSDGKKDGYVLALENKVDGQKKAMEELEGEKQSLVASVANLMHRGADTDLKKQLADARAEVVRLEQQAKATQASMQGQASQNQAQLEDANQLLTEKLQECEQGSTATKADAEVVTEVKCKQELSDVQGKLSKAEGEHDSLVQTVQSLLQGSDQLKAELAAKANCTVQVAAAPAPASSGGFDIGHMAETVKIDQYIATAGHPTENANVTSLAPIKPIKFKDSSVKAASDALAGRGDIGKYLRGAKEDNAETKQGAQAALAAADDAVDVDQQIDALMPEDVDVLKAAAAVGTKKAVRKAHGDDNLAQKLLLQAEQALKLAA